MEKYKVEIISDKTKWSFLLNKTEHHLPFSSSIWVDGICKMFMYEADLLVFYDGQDEIVLLPVFYHLKQKVKFSFHPALTPYLSPQFIKPDGLTDLQWERKKFNVLEFIERYVRLNYVYPYFFLNVDLLDVRPFTWQEWQVKPAFTFLVNPSVTKLDNEITRRARKCLNEGFKVSFDWTPKVFVDLFRLTMKRQKISLDYSDELMIELLNNMHSAGLVWMCSVYDSEGNAHVSWVQIQSRKSEVYNWNSATNLSFSNSGATSFLVVKLLNEMKANEVDVWDLCGADTPSVVSFKSKIGGTLRCYFKVSFSNYPIEKKAYFKWLNL